MSFFFHTNTAATSDEMPDHFISDFGRVAIYDGEDGRHDVLVASDYTASGEPIGVIARHSGVAELVIDEGIEFNRHGEAQISSVPVSIFREQAKAVRVAATENDPHRLAVDL